MPHNRCLLPHSRSLLTLTHTSALSCVSWFRMRKCQKRPMIRQKRPTNTSIPQLCLVCRGFVEWGWKSSDVSRACVCACVCLCVCVYPRTHTHTHTHTHTYTHLRLRQPPTLSLSRRTNFDGDPDLSALGVCCVYICICIHMYFSALTYMALTCQATRPWSLPAYLTRI